MFKNTKAKSSLRRSLNAMVNATVLKGQDKKYRGQEHKPKHTMRNIVYRKKRKKGKFTRKSEDISHYDDTK